MSDFIRPALNAITSAEELTVGTKLWHVYGIFTPFVSSHEYTVIRAPISFNQHPSWKECHSRLEDDIVFDTDNGTHQEKHFAFDGNIGAHHNNNYWFKTKEAADAYCVQCREDWESNPDEIERVQERRRQDALDSLHDDYYDDYGDF